MYAQFLIHISIAKLAYKNRESTILYYNSITLSASYGHVTFIASWSCKSSKSWVYVLNPLTMVDFSRDRKSTLKC